MRTLIALAALIALPTLAADDIHVERAQEATNPLYEPESAAQDPGTSGPASGQKASGGERETKRTPNSSKAHKKGYDHYSSQSDRSKSTMQKARHDAMQTSPRNSESKVEVRGWDPDKKEASEKGAEKKVKIPALDGSSKEPSN